MNHFTNKAGFHGIRSAQPWLFRAHQPPATYNPPGAYFTTWGPKEKDLARKLRVPRAKLEYLFAFADVGDLTPIPGGRGRLGTLFYAPKDYPVQEDRQEYSGESSDYPGKASDA